MDEARRKRKGESMMEKLLCDRVTRVHSLRKPRRSMNAQVHAPGSQPKKRGCFFYGCLTVVILGLLAGAVVGIGGYFFVKKVNQMVAEYTSTSPAEMPQVEMADAEYEALEQRVGVFGKALKEGQPSEALILSSDELNVLLNRSEAMQVGKGRLHVIMTEKEVSGQISLPLDPIAKGPLLSKLQGRYLNGTARLGVEMQNGRLVVRLLGVKVNDQLMPAELVKAFETVNLMEQVYQDPQAAQTLSKIGAVEVTDSKLVITPAAAP